MGFHKKHDNAMAKFCPTCNKTSLVAGSYSNRTRATQFNPCGKSRRQPNLQWAKLPNPAPNTPSRIKLCTRCIKAGKNLLIKS